MNKSLKINQDFKTLIPPLSPEEFAQLEQNILQSGCLNSIKTWRGYIIDGHNRHAICQKHNIPYTTEKLRFATKDQAKLWIAENQLGRRNLSKSTLIDIATKRADILQSLAKQNGQPFTRRKTIAQSAGVSEQLVHKYMQVVASGNKELISQMKNGETKINTAHKALSVASRRVETLFDYSDPQFNNSPICHSNVKRYIRDIGGVYLDLDRVGLGHDYKRVLSQLEKQLGVVSKFLFSQVKSNIDNSTLI